MAWLDYPPIIDENGIRRNREGREICGGKGHNRPGKWCGNDFQLYNPSRRCKWHGGLSPAGEEHHKWKGTNTSSTRTVLTRFRALPERMIEGVLKNLEDPSRFNLEEEAAIIRERINDLMKRVDHGESGHLWKLLRETFRELKRSQREGDREVEEAAFAKLDDLITRGTSDYQGWEEISRQFDRTQRLVESEQKRKVSENLLAPSEQVLSMLKALSMAVYDCVEDPQIRTAIQRRFNSILEPRFDAYKRSVVRVDNNIEATAPIPKIPDFSEEIL